MSTTFNTNWLNEFLNKDELEALWRNRRNKEIKKEERTVKRFTLDLNAALKIDHLKKTSKTSNSCCLREEQSLRAPKKIEKVP
jgi:hypothetical protein